MIDPNEIKTFFFRAMLAGWVGLGEVVPAPGMPGHKIAADIKEGSFRLLDIYCVNSSSPKSAGTTTIWYQDEPVWTMSYFGEYEKRAIAIVKQALDKAYRSRRFFGGRGQTILTDSNSKLTYVNDSPLCFDFVLFEGREGVYDLNTGEEVGWHSYNGMLLI